jgi:serine/threonine protein kinase
MTCSQCFAPLPADTKFCDVCGTPVVIVSDPLIGRTIADKYIIRKKLGHGGFGAVYQADEAKLDRKIALKILHPHLLSNPKTATRFCNEGLAASRVEHPYTIKVFDLGQTEDGLLWISMEYLAGETLEARLEKVGSLTAREVVNLIGPICDVLDSAHSNGIIHRDLKPENIMLLPTRGKPIPKVLDFGLAGLLNDPLNKQVISGTPMYMPPEQWEGLEHTDARTDIYALGVIAYECRAGRLPFKAETREGWINAHCEQEPPDLETLLSGNSGSPLLNRAIMKALEKKPKDRYQNAQEFKEALEDAIRIDEPATIPEEALLKAAESNAALSAVQKPAPGPQKKEIHLWLALVFVPLLLAFLWLRYS